MDAVFTRAEYMRLPEGFPAQLIEGCLVKTPSPTYGHQFFIGRIYSRLKELVGERRVVMAPCDIPLDDLNVYQPDVWSGPTRLRWRLSRTPTRSPALRSRSCLHRPNDRTAR